MRLSIRVFIEMWTRCIWSQFHSTSNTLNINLSMLMNGLGILPNISPTDGLTRVSRAFSSKDLCVDENSFGFLFCFCFFWSQSKEREGTIHCREVCLERRQQTRKNLLWKRRKRSQANSSVVDKFALCDFASDFLVSFAERVISARGAGAEISIQSQTRGKL